MSKHTKTLETFTVELTAEDVLGLSAAMSDSWRNDEAFPHIALQHLSVSAVRDDAWAKIQIAYLAHRGEDSDPRGSRPRVASEDHRPLVEEPLLPAVYSRGAAADRVSTWASDAPVGPNVLMA